MRTPSPLLPETFNSRDVGGMPAAGGTIRTGRLVRSEAPKQLGERGHAALAALGIRTLLDLREPIERELDAVDLDGLPVRRRNVPILGGDIEAHRSSTLAEIYFELLECRGAAFGAAVRELCEPEALPALVFCSAGKDRTGLVVALALGAVGAREEAIVTDYALTQRAMEGRFREVIEVRAAAAGISEQELAVKMGAPPELMREVLDWLRQRHGDAAGYLRHHGLTEQDLNGLRRGLVQ